VCPCASLHGQQDSGSNKENKEVWLKPWEVWRGAARTMAGRRRLEGEPAPVYGKCRKLGVVVHGFDA